MLAPLLALTSLATPLPQDCVQDLPLPGGPLSFLGNHMVASDDYVAASGFPSQASEEIFIWSQATPGAFVLEASLDTGGNVDALAAEGDALAAAIRVGGDSEVIVWQRDAVGAWTPDPPIVPPTATGSFGGPLAIDGDRLVARAQGPRIWVYERDAASGSWTNVQTIQNPPTVGSSFGFSVQLEGERLAAIAGNFSEGAIEVYQRDAAGQFQHDATVGLGERINDLALDGERFALVREDDAEVWRRRPNGTWVRDQLLPTQGMERLVDVALEGRWIAVGGLGRSSSFDVSRPALTYERVGAGQNWLQRASFVPAGGIGGAESFFGVDLGFTDGYLVASEPAFDAGTGGALDQGRITALEIDCIDPLPVVQWVPAEIRSNNTASFPASFAPTTVTTGLPVNPGPALGLRNSQLVLDADFQLDVTGLPCTDDYTTNVCTFFAHGLRDVASGSLTDPFPIDPSGGVPQVFGFAPGPAFPASTGSSQVTWPFELAASVQNSFSLEPTGLPMEFELAGSTYNCIDVTGVWFQADPDVEAFASSCFFQSVPASVQSLDLEFGYDAEVAFEVPALGGANQFTVCDGMPNSVGTGGVLEAQGSAAVTDNLLFVAATDLPPQQPGLLFLSMAAATPPFQTLGQGELCIEAPLIRLTSSFGFTSGAGHYTTQLDLANLPQGTVILPGSTWYLQLAYRDINPQGTSNTSSAIGIAFD